MADPQMVQATRSKFDALMQRFPMTKSATATVSNIDSAPERMRDLRSFVPVLARPAGAVAMGSTAAPSRDDLLTTLARVRMADKKKLVRYALIGAAVSVALVLVIWLIVRYAQPSQRSSLALPAAHAAQLIGIQPVQVIGQAPSHLNSAAGAASTAPPPLPPPLADDPYQTQFDVQP